jgi:hypothetical protein
MTKLSERAMLVTLHLSAWGGMMHDKGISEEVNESYKAEKAAGRYNKRLVASQFLNGVQSAHLKARRLHRLLTLPWEDDGTRILASVGFLKYQQKMQECRRDSEEEVKKFLGTTDEYIAEAKVRLGKMFNVDDYPGANELAFKFGFDVEVKPIPESSDFRAKLSDETTKAVTKDIEKRLNQRLENAQNEIFRRIAELVKHMSERLRDYVPPKDNNRSQGVIRDTVVYNIHELATEVLPVMNITEDPRIEQLRKQLLDELVEHSPEILRADAKVRQQVITKADKILKKVEGYMA